jgi:hypothetical protein
MTFVVRWSKPAVGWHIYIGTPPSSTRTALSLSGLLIRKQRRGAWFMRGMELSRSSLPTTAAIGFHSHDTPSRPYRGRVNRGGGQIYPYLRS